MFDPILLGVVLSAAFGIGYLIGFMRGCKHGEDAWIYDQRPEDGK